MVVGPAGRRVEGRNAVEVEDEIFSVADRGRVMLVARQPHCREKAKRAAFGKRPFFFLVVVGEICAGGPPVKAIVLISWHWTILYGFADN